MNKGPNHLYNSSVMLETVEHATIPSNIQKRTSQLLEVSRIANLHSTSTIQDGRGTVKAVMVKGTTVGSSPSLARSVRLYSSHSQQEAIDYRSWLEFWNLEDRSQFHSTSYVRLFAWLLISQSKIWNSIVVQIGSYRPQKSTPTKDDGSK